jgi:threonine dehydrogenase-like Zn-dependent dehydrogenase
LQPFQSKTHPSKANNKSNTASVTIKFYNMQTLAGNLIPKRDEAPVIHTQPNRDESAPKMKTVQWYGTQDMRVVEEYRPVVTDPSDVIVKVTSAAICGSDLHIYTGVMPGMKKGDIMGHETMGIIEQVGPQVKNFKVGDRVVVAFDIACNHCTYCHKGAFSGCDNTNPSKEQEMLYGHRTAGLFGYSHLTGGYPGGQAEYLRVPLADVNCLKINEDASELSDDHVILISDVLSTAWHATELASVEKNDTVAIWGAGPVGVLAAHCAQVRGASRVVLIDQDEFRLQFARQRLPGVETIDFTKKKTLTALHEMFQDEQGRYVGPDCCIEAVGFHYTKSWTHWIEMAFKLENDPSETLNELINAVRKAGRIGVVGVYAGYCNHLNIGAFMEKGLTMSAGQTPVQKYWKKLYQMVKAGTLHPEMVITHHMDLQDGPAGYKKFNDKEDGCVKVILKPEGVGSGGKQARREQ